MCGAEVFANFHQNVRVEVEALVATPGGPTEARLNGVGVNEVELLEHYHAAA